MSQRQISPARQAVAITCSIIAAVCSITVAVMESADTTEDTRRSEYEECLSEERARIAQEGGLLEAEDLCDISPGRP